MNHYAKKKITKINKAINEAKRFIASAELARLRLTCDENVYSSKEVATCKRASMDLSRVLADLRKPE